jgi:hypothetical protein
MKSMFPMTASLILAVLMNANIRGQESSAPPEMKALEGLLGTWEVLTVSKVAKWTPEETRSTTICKREPILGGRYFRESAFDQQGKLLATGMLTYDTNKRIYRFWYFHPEGVNENAGTWDGSSRTLSLQIVRGEGVTGVLTLQLRDETTIEWKSTMKDVSGEVCVRMEGKAVRQK